MGTGLLTSLLLAIAPAAAQAPLDTLAFATPATRAVVERAIVRHRAQDSLVQDYGATLRYRLSVSIGQRRWARIAPTAVEEQEAVVQWQRPNDLRVDFLGRRSRSRSGDMNLNSTFSNPWFVPRSLGDSVRIFGNEFPERAALHPLAADAPEWYRYTLGDSLSIAMPNGESVTLVSVEFAPRQVAPALIVGRLWLDAATAEVVRLSFQYVGTGLWVTPEEETRRDSTSARRANSLINRLLSVRGDLEYALQEGRYWMPYRQVIAGRIQIPIISDIVVPFEAITTFSDYAINTGEAITFRIALDSVPLTAEQRRARRDSLARERRDPDNVPDPDRARTWSGRLGQGGRFEMRRPPLDSLREYAAWGDSLDFDLSAAEARRLRESLADLERLAARLPGRMTGRPGAGLSYERLADVIRYNRVQGLSLGAGYQVRVPGTAFTQAFATARYGFSDERINLRASVVRDAPNGRWTLSGYREVMGVDPLRRGGELANTWRGIVMGRDENDYLLASGARLSFETSVALGTELTLWTGAERQQATVTTAKSAINDLLGGTGEFPPNGPVSTGTYGFAGARLDGGFPGRTRWTVAADALAGEGDVVGRGWARVEQRFGRRNPPTVRVSAGTTTRREVDQMAFRIGAGQTVRGFDYATLRAQAFWSVQVDVPAGRRWFHPIFFVDAAQAGTLSGRGGLWSAPVLVGGGVGWQWLGGLVRVDVTRALVHREYAGDGVIVR